MTIAPGSPIQQSDGFSIGVVTGYFACAATGRPMMLTAAHLFSPDVWTGSEHSGAAVIEPRAEKLLIAPGARAAVARLRRVGRFDKLRPVRSFDAAVSEVRDPAHAVLSLAGAAAREGQRVGKLSGAFTSGTIVAVGFDSGHYGSDCDLLIEGDDGMLFSRPGDSGAPVVDADGRTVAMVSGQIRLGSKIYCCAHPLGEVRALFGLEDDKQF